MLLCTRERAQARTLRVGVVVLAGVQGLAVVAARLVTPLRSMPLGMEAILGDGISNEPNLAALTSNRLVIPDYYGENVLRTGGFFGNPTWAAGLAAAALIIVFLDKGRASGSAAGGPSCSRRCAPSPSTSGTRGSPSSRRSWASASGGCGNGCGSSSARCW